MVNSMRIRRRVRPCPLRPQGRRQGQAGFTLIEMMVVVAIIGIVMAIAMPAYSSWQERTAVTSAASSLMAHLKQARTLAMAENRSISVTLASNSYTFDADTSGTCGQCKNLTVSLSQFSNNLALSTNLTPVTFSSSGSINSLGATITFAASGYSRDITVNMIGRAYY